MLTELLHQHQQLFHPLLHTNNSIFKILNLTASNQSLNSTIVNDTELFSQFITNEIASSSATFGIGGYNEHRTVYSRSTVFDDAEEPRRLHLGIDIWGEVDTPIFLPLDGYIHSFAFNHQYGDYGATIIMQHELQSHTFYTLYGHLAVKNLSSLIVGEKKTAGTLIGNFGKTEENGAWPPHVHFQIIEDIADKKGDYPGVCKFSEKDTYLKNCPDPDIVLQLMNQAIE
ncbi:MAG: peptidoglycan DD-metalloendopeptidase family protein [Chitinophagaceae bacterium]